jgi:microcin C transport system substrate-binding protein
LSIQAKEIHWGNFWEAAGMMAFPKHVWKNKNFNDIRYEFPVVSGPYRINMFREDRFVELERRADWWGFQKTGIGVSIILKKYAIVLWKIARRPWNF